MHKSIPLPDPAPLGYRVKEAEKATGIRKSALYKLMADGKLRFTQIGAVRIIPAGALKALIEGGADA